MERSLWVSLALSAVGLAILAWMLLSKRKDVAARARANSRLPPLITLPPSDSGSLLPVPVRSASGNGRNELHSVPQLRPQEGIGAPRHVERVVGPDVELGDGEVDDRVDGPAIRFDRPRPRDGTLRMLPGRLEIVEGDDHGRDIRFVQTSEGIPEITFGRTAGPPHRHVQLLSRTVSRKHAVIEYDAGRWRITNLSVTNPVVVNDAELLPPNDQRVLTDGDRIEMGEVVFRYRER